MIMVLAWIGGIVVGLWALTLLFLLVAYLFSDRLQSKSLAAVTQHQKAFVIGAPVSAARHSSIVSVWSFDPADRRVLREAAARCYPKTVEEDGA